MDTQVTPLRCVLAAIVAFVVMGVIEFALVASSVPVFDAGTGAGLALLLHIVGLDGLAGLLIGVCLALVVPALVAATHPWQWTRRHVYPATETPGLALNNAAAWICALMFALGPVALAAGIAGRIAHGFMNPSLVLPFTALGAVMGIGLGAMAVFPVRALVRWALNKIVPNGRLAGLATPAWPVVLVVLLNLYIAYRIGGMDLGAFKLGALYVLAGGSLLALLLIAVWRDRPPVRPGVGALVCVGLVFGGAIWAIVGLANSPISARVIPLNGHLSRSVVATLRTVFDGDGDGYSEMLAGGDCDDSNPKINPSAKEIPGNGVDENCAGGDAPLIDAADIKPPSATLSSVPSSGIASAASAAPATEAPPKKKLNVVFVIIDTLRPDHLGLYGYERATSPVIDAWAKDAVVFENAFAQGPNTPRSMPSIFTGRYPSRVDWVKRYANYGKLKPDNQTIFEIFGAAGWATEAISAHWYFERADGIKQGVDTWDNSGFTTIKKSNTQTMAHKLTPRAISRIDALAGGEKPFFLFVHYFEPHGRYMNQKSATIFGKKLMDKYDSEISYVDKHLAPLFDTLKAKGLYENTVVVVTADHGEAFKEHGFYFHGRTVYTEELKVPLLIRAPGIAPKRVKDFVGLVDLLPTLAGLSGLKAPKAQGKDLGPVLDGTGTLAARYLFMEQLAYPNYKTHIVAALNTESGVKAIKDITKNVIEVFNVKADPAEQKNLLDTDPKAGEDVRKALNQFIDTDPG
ncbi:MAG: choline-sulfatase [Bradymonadia bacterium]